MYSPISKWLWKLSHIYKTASLCYTYILLSSSIIWKKKINAMRLRKQILNNGSVKGFDRESKF